MNAAYYPLTPIDLRSATDQQYAALTEFSNRTRAEKLPDDPPVPVEDRIKTWQNLPAFMEVHYSAVWDQAQTQIIAGGQIQITRTGDNQHMAPFGIDVLPEHRRQGLGRRLLAEVAVAAVQEKRRLLLADTCERIPEGEVFMARLGASRGMEMHINQLKLGEVDRGLLHAWQEHAREAAREFMIGFWEGAYPEQQLVEIAQLNEVMNQEPHGTLDIEDFHFTPEQLRQIEKGLFADGSQRWTMYVSERSTGAFAGLTEVMWRPSHPEIMEQEGTGVWPHYRNRGLGRWLKAAMLEKILNERPGVKFIRTGNADSNAAMLKINNELGFKPYLSQCIWQVEVQRVSEYLGKAAAS